LANKVINIKTPPSLTLAKARARRPQQISKEVKKNN